MEGGGVGGDACVFCGDACVFVLEISGPEFVEMHGGGEVEYAWSVFWSVEVGRRLEFVYVKEAGMFVSDLGEFESFLVVGVDGYDGVAFCDERFVDPALSGGGGVAHFGDCEYFWRPLGDGFLGVFLFVAFGWGG